MSNKIVFSPFSIVIASLAITACGTQIEYKNAGQPTTATGSATAPTAQVSSLPTSIPLPTGTVTAAAATFQQVNAQIFSARCTSCHSSGSPNFSSYGAFAQNTNYIVPGNPSSSAVYQAVQSGSMPQGGARLSQSDLDLLASWISDGAKND